MLGQEGWGPLVWFHWLQTWVLTLFEALLSPSPQLWEGAPHPVQVCQAGREMPGAHGCSGAGKGREQICSGAASMGPERGGLSEAVHEVQPRAEPYMSLHQPGPASEAPFDWLTERCLPMTLFCRLPTTAVFPGERAKPQTLTGECTLSIGLKESKAVL